MKTVLKVEAIFLCSLNRAFRTPILGDATQFLVGYGPVPGVVKFTEDHTWGKPGGTRIPHSARNLLSKGGPIGKDEVILRKENEYWKWGVKEFYQPSLGYTAFIGEMNFSTLGNDKIAVEWTYTLHSNSKLAYPFHSFFGQLFWKGQMKIAIQKMKKYAESDAPFLYE